ncbi:MAG TPA: NADH-quinone oxidoreductase subunit F [Sediminispirochaeta sp.]|nr:NADH-quinone oxidoreductase subunit F [Sediminispirochaeta sp.]
MVNPIMLILIPLLTVFLINLVNIKWPKFSAGLSFLAIALTTGMAFTLLPEVMQAPIEVVIAGTKAPIGINLLIGPLGLMLSLIILVTSLLVSMYSFSYISDERKGMYSGLFLLLIVGSLGMVMTGDIFNLFVFFEILCISSYILVAYQRNEHSLEASIKYLLLGSIGSLFLLISIAILYRGLGTLNIADIAARVGELPPSTRIAAAAFFTIGIGVEAAIFPLNSWLPDAHSSAPSSISAMLSGFVIEVALVVLIKIVFSLFAFAALFWLLAVVGVVSLLIGEFAAYRQENIKRMLAYSSIGQVGLILFALSLGTEAATRAAFLQIINHAAAKSALFLVSGYMIIRTGSYQIADYRGIARRMPVSGFVFFLAVLSLVGVPPLFGFFSKFSIVMAAVSSGSTGATVLTGLVLLGTVVEAAYFIRVLQHFYQREPAKAVTAARSERGAGAESSIEAPIAAMLPVLAFALFLTGGVLLLGSITGLADAAVQDLFARLVSVLA